MFGVTVLVFAAVRLAPGDTALALAGFDASAEALEAIRREYGLDRPAHEQFARYFSGLVQLDLGRSTTTRLPVAEELASRIPVTATLAFGATIFAVIVGIGLGTIAARSQRTLLDYSVMVTALFGLSVPNYVVGLALILVFAVSLRWLPATGTGTPMHYVLPVVTIGLIGAGVLARHTRSAILEVLAEDYVRTARSKGLPEWRTLFQHALPNALIPLTTIIGLLFGALLGGTVIVETIFGISGVGRYMIDRITSRDYVAVQGGVLLIANVYILVNLLTDLLYGVIDKRVRLR